MDEKESRELNGTMTQILTELRMYNINITRLIDLLLTGDLNEQK